MKLSEALAKLSDLYAETGRALQVSAQRPMKETWHDLDIALEREIQFLQDLRTSAKDAFHLTEANRNEAMTGTIIPTREPFVISNEGGRLRARITLTEHNAIFVEVFRQEAPLYSWKRLEATTFEFSRRGAELTEKFLHDRKFTGRVLVG